MICLPDLVLNAIFLDGQIVCSILFEEGSIDPFLAVGFRLQIIRDSNLIQIDGICRTGLDIMIAFNILRTEICRNSSRFLLCIILGIKVNMAILLDIDAIIADQIRRHIIMFCLAMEIAIVSKAGHNPNSTVIIHHEVARCHIKVRVGILTVPVQRKDGRCRRRLASHGVSPVNQIRRSSKHGVVLSSGCITRHHPEGAIVILNARIMQAGQPIMCHLCMRIIVLLRRHGLHAARVIRSRIHKGGCHLIKGLTIKGYIYRVGSIRLTGEKSTNHHLLGVLGCRGSFHRCRSHCGHHRRCQNA